jgi:hypothetical protein
MTRIVFNAKARSNAEVQSEQERTLGEPDWRVKKLGFRIDFAPLLRKLAKKTSC